MDYTAMGKRIRQERERQKMTQAELAAMIGRSTSFCGHLERGSRIPSLETLVRASQALGMSLQYMVLGTAVAAPGHSNNLLGKLIDTLISHAEEWLPG